MAFHLYEDTWETSTTTGTGAYALGGAASSGGIAYRPFSAQYVNGDTCFYSAYDGTNWEHGLGTYNTGNTLSRTKIYRSSNANAAVSWAAGTRQIVVTALGYVLEGALPPNALGVPPALSSSAAGTIAAVIGPTTAGHVAIFNDTAGTIADGGTTQVSGPSSSITGDVPKFSDTTGKVLNDGYTPTDITKTKMVMVSAPPTSGNIARFTDGVGTVGDGGVAAANVVTNTGTSTTGHVPKFNDATGKVLADGYAVATTSTANALVETGGGGQIDPSFLPAAAPALPTGSVVPFAGSAAPTGFLLCGGQAVSRTIYATLFSTLGTTYGAGDGSTTFNVPDLRGRAVFGVDNMGGTAANRVTSGGSGIVGTTEGAAGGAETVTLSTAQIPSHAHGYTAPTFSAIAAGLNNGFTGPAPCNAGSWQNTTAATTGSAGSGNPSLNMPPTIMLNYIIKT